MYRCIMYAVLGLTVALLAGCTAIENKKKAEKAPVAVTVALVGDNSNELESQSYSGVLTENYSANLAFQMGGKLLKTYVSEGDYVKKGMRLAEVDPTQSKNALETAEATLAQAVDGYKRLKTMHDSGSISEVKWVEMETKLKQAQSMAQIARRNLEDCTLRAPFDGRVSGKLFGDGTQLLPSQPFIEIINTDTMLVKVAVPEDDISNINIGDNAIIQVLSLGTDSLSGKVTSKGIDASNTSHTYCVKVAVPNKDGRLLSGMVCRCIIKKSPQNSGFTIPYQAVQLMQDGNYVWCVKDGKTTRRRIETGGFSSNGVVITKGLSKGDTVVVDGRQKVYENCTVQIND